MTGGRYELRVARQQFGDEVVDLSHVGLDVRGTLIIYIYNH